MMFVNFIGKDRVGKSTSAEMLHELLIRHDRIKTIRRSFADSLRDEIVELYNIDADLVYNQKIDKAFTIIDLDVKRCHPEVLSLWQRYMQKETLPKQISLRDLLVNHGTPIRRMQDPNYWVDRFDSWVNRQDADLIITDDGRFPNELEYTKDNGESIIFWLNNNHDNGTNIAQESILEWYRNNHHIVHHINVGVPLTKYDAEFMLRKHVIPKILKMKGYNGKSNKRPIGRSWKQSRMG